MGIKILHQSRILFIGAVLVISLLTNFANVLCQDPEYEADSPVGDSLVINSINSIAAQLLGNSTEETYRHRSRTCGKRFARWQDKIVGGRGISIKEVPYQCSLQSISRWLGTPTHYCGGTIVSTRHVVTAAHCVQGFRASNVRVVCGTDDLRSTSNAAVRSVKSFVPHPKYNTNTIENDIAIVVLNEPLDISGRSAPTASACLPSHENECDGPYNVTGWGRLSESGIAPSTLMSVEVPRISNSECDEAYPDKIMDSMLCAGYKEGRKDACQGDSGGPLVQINHDSTYLCGVVSWGIGCARPGRPGVYTRVAHYVDWIEEQIHGKL